MRRLVPYLLLVAVIVAARGTAFAAERVVEIAVRDGVTLKILENMDAGPTAPVAVLMIGGNGVAKLDTWDGRGDPNGNFLTRSRHLFAEAGFNTALPDAPSDRQNRAGLANSRIGRVHAEDLGTVIAHLRKASSGPVFVIGTSRGTISAANAGARLGDGGIRGIVLTATVTRENRRGNRDPVQSVALEKIGVPVLLVHHRDDACYVCVPDDIPELAKAFTAAPSVAAEMVSGGSGRRGDDCGPFQAHGFAGIEAEVVALITRWTQGVIARR